MIEEVLSWMDYDWGGLKLRLPNAVFFFFPLFKSKKVFSTIYVNEYSIKLDFIKMNIKWFY
jgi:hypothetical protein